MFLLKSQKKQKGQSLIYVAVLMLILVSGVFFVFDIGNMVNTKIKFQNAADAAALAAVSTKINKHHMDAIVRTAMYHEAMAAQAQQKATQALLLKIIMNVDSAIPGTDTEINLQQNQGGDIGIEPVPSEAMKEDAKRYRLLANLTYKHVMKLHRERKALERYYIWISNNGKTFTQEAARAGFLGNTLGLLNPINPYLAKNIRLLTDSNDLLENGPFSKAIGGVAYSDEAAKINGVFGKTYIEFDGTGITTRQGASLLKYFNKYTLTTSAAARIASSEELKTGKTRIREPGFTVNPGKLFLPFEMWWYTPRLMAIEKRTEYVIH